MNLAGQRRPGFADLSRPCARLGVLYPENRLEEADTHLIFAL